MLLGIVCSEVRHSRRRACRQTALERVLANVDSAQQRLGFFPRRGNRPIGISADGDTPLPSGSVAVVQDNGPRPVGGDAAAEAPGLGVVLDAVAARRWRKPPDGSVGQSLRHGLTTLVSALCPPSDCIL